MPLQTVRFKNELERNITIKLGYANAKIFKCQKCPRPGCFKAYGSSKEDHPKCTKPGCDGTMEVNHDALSSARLNLLTLFYYQLLRHVSFVDCPGHDILMATMLNGAAVMDAALLLIAGNEPCPQPQVR